MAKAHLLSRAAGRDVGASAALMSHAAEVAARIVVETVAAPAALGQPAMCRLAPQVEVRSHGFGDELKVDLTKRRIAGVAPDAHPDTFSDHPAHAGGRGRSADGSEGHREHVRTGAEPVNRAIDLARDFAPTFNLQARS